MFNATTTDTSHTDLQSAAAPASIDRGCATVNFAELVAMLGETVDVDAPLAEITFPVRRLRAGETLHRAGDRFDAIYVVRSGFMKTMFIDHAGTEQVLAFPMSGDVIGLDGVDPSRYTADVVALDNSHVVVVSFARIAQLGREHPAVERLLYRVFSRELVRERSMIWLLGALSADARVAAFLLGLSERFGRIGCSRSSFVLRMTRQEMGSYLGIKLETVSRTLSAFAASGLIDVRRKLVTLRDLAALRHIVQPLDEPAFKPLCKSVQHAAPSPAHGGSKLFADYALA